jgi:hypothetical protein
VFLTITDEEDFSSCAGFHKQAALFHYELFEEPVGTTPGAARISKFCSVEPATRRQSLLVRGKAIASPTLLLHLIATRYRKPACIGTYVISVLQTWLGRSIETPRSKYAYTSWPGAGRLKLGFG